jgi:nicotinamidase/pyrazinamidase
MVRTLLWDVDTQLDFMEPDGKLPIPGAASIRPAISRLTNLLPNTCIMSGSVDAHTPRDPEFKVWPEHCVYGTPGQRKIPESTRGTPLFIPSTKLKAKQIREDFTSGGQILFEKQHNAVETNPNTYTFLKAVNPDRIVVYGVASDICVDDAVRYLAEAMGYKVIVVSDAIKGIDPKKINKCMDEWHSLGVNLRKTDEIIAELRRKDEPGQDSV